MELAFIPGSYGDQSASTALDFDLPMGSVVWQDNPANEGIDFATQRKKNSLCGDDFPTYMAKKYNRKKVETSISEITTRFPKRIHAVSIDGFQFKTFFCVLALMLIKYFQV